MPWEIEVVDGCAIVRMNTNKMNVQNETFFADVHDAFDRLENDLNELPVVLTGHEGVFSAGLDFINSFDIFASGTLDRIRDWYHAYRETNLRIFQYPRPTVAAINGHAVAGGLITAFDCDFRVAARRPSKFGLNEVPIGIPMPAAYVEIIKYAVGNHVAAQAILRGQLYDLETAERLGFFHEVVEPDQLLSTAIGYAHSITPNCNTAYAMAKKALKDGTIRQIEERSVVLDDLWPEGMKDPGSRKAQELQREVIMSKKK